MKKGFTLAEVLITLGIIGVVAALTLPSLIANYQKKQTVVKLKRFYTIMNQAIRLSEIDNGPAEDWIYPVLNDDYTSMRVFYDRYFANYIVSTKVKSCRLPETTVDWVCIYYFDGTAALMRNSNGIDILFYPNAKYINQNFSFNGRHRFAFNFNKANTGVSKIQQYQIEPYTHQWDGTRAGLIFHSGYGCRKGAYTIGNFCAKLIQYDGWEIKDDYPW
ncbi:MAG: type II secretion system GspH family protein [Heliobacteriaceae bacterium]|jgi:prepilin-type N-terminal cleavage/methylation domain-containing protein|nr:type II secretion system GspH family protein [Heliobacteriaceae bacterium]